ncbi:hypothetical protein OGAPHI_005146 [Ogataea philodendri]|uniref:mRNA 3'-end-processing protein RNA14 n=2 Tax=Saccharomycotina TaxID=147537 RepID=A0A9P8P287_9ASCO|nr:uncharacterized protein OGAPHI_005146 [Ogataea philodendri]KAH3663744.1 hypothetical protein OGAPHI_005146 [Ogataea philodendri]
METKKRKLDNPDTLETLSGSLDRSRWLALVANSPSEEVFEAYLKIFFNDGHVWKLYIDHEMDKNDDGKVEQLFARCLTKVYDVELWKVYLKYVRKVNDIITGGEQARLTVMKAYDFATDNVGLDFINGQAIWDEYFKFLNEWNPVSSIEQTSKTSQLRSLYRKLISTPLRQLDKNWKKYLDFENETDQMNARRHINEKSQEYMKLRPLNQNLINLTAHLKPSEERKNSRNQLEFWKRWINWERSNKLNLTPELLDKRVNFVYRLSTQYLRFQPEVWYNYAVYLVSKDLSSDAVELLQQGIVLNPQSVSLVLVLSSHYERGNEIEKIKDIWNTLIAHLTKQYEEEQDNKVKATLAHCITSTYSLLMKACRRTEGMKEARAVFSGARKFAGITWHVFVDYAMMEHQNNDLKIAMRCFELAMKYYGQEFAFVEVYLNYLLSLNDLGNAKKLLEQSIENFKDKPSLLEKVYRQFYPIELEFGDSNSIRSLEKRYREAFPQSSEFQFLSKSFPDFNVVKLLDEYTLKGSEEALDKVEEIKLEDVEIPQIEPFVVRDEIYNLLRYLPKSEYYDDKPQVFDVKKSVQFFRTLKLT